MFASHLVIIGLLALCPSSEGDKSRIVTGFNFPSMPFRFLGGEGGMGISVIVEIDRGKDQGEKGKKVWKRKSKGKRREKERE